MAHTQAQVAVGYFENTVAGKITEPWVAGFRATFIIYRGRPSVYRQIKMKIDPFTNVYHTWNVYLATSERRGARL